MHQRHHRRVLSRGRYRITKLERREGPVSPMRQVRRDSGRGGFAMNRILEAVIAASILGVLGVDRVEASGVFFAQGLVTTCTLTLPPLVPTEYQVVAVLGGDGSSSGITGAEFRIEGASPGFT